MAIDPLSASKAYLEAARAAAKATGGASPGEEAGGLDFGQMVQHALQETAQTAKVAEQKSFAAAAGNTDIVDVVTALSAAETSLQTVVAIRDQVISAYQEIMRMPI